MGLFLPGQHCPWSVQALDLSRVEGAEVRENPPEYHGKDGLMKEEHRLIIKSLHVVEKRRA